MFRLAGAEAEHAFGVGGSGCGDGCGRRALQLCYFCADKLRVGRFVALAAVGCRCEVGAVGLEQDVVGVHFAYGLGCPAVLEGDDSADAEEKIAAGFQTAVGCCVFAESVEDAPESRAAERFDDGRHFGPGIARVYGDGKVQVDGQAALAAESLGLLVAEIGRPIEIEPDFTYGAETRDSVGRRSEQLLHQFQLLAPARIVVDRRGVEPHHRDAAAGMAAAEVEKTAVALRVDGGAEHPPDPGVDGPGEGLLAVGIELGFVEVAMGVDDLHLRGCFAGANVMKNMQMSCCGTEDRSGVLRLRSLLV